MKFGNHVPVREKKRESQSPMAVFTRGLQTPGTQWEFKFPNGYGASVINDGYGADTGRYELAVLNSGGSLTYDTPITSNVLGFLTEAEVAEALDRVAALGSEAAPAPAMNTPATPATYRGTLNYHGLDLMLDVYTDGTEVRHEVRTRPVLRDAWTTWSAPVTLTPEPSEVRA